MGVCKKEAIVFVSTIAMVRVHDTQTVPLQSVMALFSQHDWSTMTLHQEPVSRASDWWRSVAKVWVLGHVD